MGPWHKVFLFLGVIGTIINAMGLLFDIRALKIVVATVGGIKYTVGGLAMAMSRTLPWQLPLAARCIVRPWSFIRFSP